MFNFPLLEGNRAHSLDDVNSIVLTEDLAKKLFDHTDPINKIIKVNNKDSYKVTGVLKNLPDNTEFDFNYLVSLSTKEIFSDNTWSNYSYYTYVQLQPGVSVEKFNNKIKNETARNSPGIASELFLYILEPFTHTPPYYWCCNIINCVFKVLNSCEL